MNEPDWYCIVLALMLQGLELQEISAITCLSRQQTRFYLTEIEADEERKKAKEQRSQPSLFVA